ncbi:MAG: hypothetical protein FJW35_12815 [Acidobacteria bacterium]|nr:hypothetical protein [Acidobacteriota bacterium]
MEPVEGRTLRALAGLSLEELCRLGAQAARALCAAHAAGIVHHDIKPENTMVREDGSVKELDYRVEDPAGRGSGRTPAARQFIGGQLARAGPPRGRVAGGVHHRAAPAPTCSGLEPNPSDLRIRAGISRHMLIRLWIQPDKHESAFWRDRRAARCKAPRPPLLHGGRVSEASGSRGISAGPRCRNKMPSYLCANPKVADRNGTG